MPLENKNTKACLLALLVIIVAFACLAALETATASTLKAIGLDAYLISTVPGVFQRYLAWLVVGGLSLIAFVWYDAKKLEGFDRMRALAFYGTFGFFFCYLILTRCLQFPMCVDDSYIDFRYVYNWAMGISPDYNPGERVMGFTSHLHVVPLTVLLWLFKSVDLSVISQNLNIALGVASYFLVYRFLQEVSGKPLVALGGAAVYSLFPYNTVETMAGKETLIVSFLMIASLWFIHKQKEAWVAWIAACLVLARPEGGLWMMFTIVWSWRQRGLSVWKLWLGPFVLLVAALAILFYSFGTVVPHSLVGKTNMFYKPFPMMDMVLVLRRLGDGMLVPEFNLPIEQPFSDIYDFFRLYGGTIVVLLLLRFMKKGALQFYGLVSVAYFLLYSITNPYLFPWYYCWFSLVPPLLVPALVDRLLEYRKTAATALQKTLAASLCAYLVLVQVVQQPIRIVAGLPAICFYWNGAFERLLIYKKAAEYIASTRKDKNAVLSSGEVGVLGYYYPGAILDLGGLVDDKVIRYKCAPQEIRKGMSLFSINPLIIKDFKPQYIVTDASFGELGLFREQFFKDNYKQEKFYPLNLWSEGFYIFKLKDGGKRASAPGTISSGAVPLNQPPDTSTSPN